MILSPIPLLLSLHCLAAGSTPNVPADLGCARGWCIEARTASVFVGACHFGAEATTAGREAIIAWHFEAGSNLDVDLAEVDVAAAIVGDANLADPAVPRHAILYFSDRDTPSKRQAASALLRAHFGSVLGAVSQELVIHLREEFDGERYRIEGGDVLKIEGALLPGRDCCRMPFSVWYRPFTPLAGAVVGCNAVFRYSNAKLGAAWERFEENAAFAGSFAIPSDPSSSAR